MRTGENPAGVTLKWKVRCITQLAWLDVVQIWSCTPAAITGIAERVATARKWTQDQSLHLSGYKWVGRGSRRLHQSVWHLTQCSAGWRKAAANLAALFSLFNYALPFPACISNVHFWTWSTSSSNSEGSTRPAWFHHRLRCSRTDAGALIRSAF